MKILGVPLGTFIGMLVRSIWVDWRIRRNERRRALHVTSPQMPRH